MLENTEGAIKNGTQDEIKQNKNNTCWPPPNTNHTNNLLLKQRISLLSVNMCNIYKLVN